MSEYSFPCVLPEVASYTRPEEGPWGERYNSAAWIEENIHKFLFPIEDIESGTTAYAGPGDGPSAGGVYFLMMDGLVGYVGMADNISKRLAQHFINPDKPFTHYWCITGIPGLAIPEVEQMYIEWLRPPMNGKYVGCCEAAEALIKDLEPQIPLED